MTSDHHEEKVKDLLAHWAELYNGLVKLLAQLPIPISIPVLGKDLTKTTLDHVARAATIIHDQPITPQAQDLIAQALTFWLAAYDLIAVFDQTRVPYREVAATLTLQQVAVLSILAIQELEEDLSE